MGIDGFWIGYEGTRSGYAKQQGRPVEEILTEFREHGITVLASMIVGFDYQNPDVVAQELDGLLKLKPALAQFLIYGPVPGTPFYERVIKENLLQDVYTQTRTCIYRRADGFTHDDQTPDALAGGRSRTSSVGVSSEDFQRLGPSIFRVLETRLLGYQKLKNSPNPLLRAEGRVLRRRSCGWPIRCFSPAGCSAPTPPCAAGLAIWSGASTRSWAAPRSASDSSPSWPWAPRCGPG